MFNILSDSLKWWFENDIFYANFLIKNLNILVYNIFVTNFF
jgi:hypothetical protein